jgi:low temperature requirement protein LtrA
LTAGVITTALVGMTIATALWWTYFDWVAIVLEHRLRQETGTAQTTLARDAFSYLHFVMVAGIVLFAMSLKKALAHYDAHLAVVPATALCAGLGAYLLAHVLLRYRISGTIGRGRPVAFAGLMVLWPFADHMPALAALSVAAAIFVALIAYEAIRYREPRSFIRHGGVPTPEAMRAQRVRTG